MKAKILTLIATIAIIAYLISTAVAVPAPISYDLERTAPTGSVNIGDIVTMTGTTTNTLVNAVMFTWYAPDGTLVENYTDSTLSDDFTSSHVVDAVGTWTVIATFERFESDGHTLKPIEFAPMTYQIDAEPESFFVVPEYPLIGAAGVAIPLALALLVFKRKQIVTQ
jgi:hypothetical protein